jgi:5-methylcytosine-specific restriction endonuclease McrA
MHDWSSAYAAISRNRGSRTLRLPLPALRRPRKRPPRYNRAAIFAAYAGTCAYCDAPAEHLDHVVPLSRGGADLPHNLLPACAPCNLGKGALSLAEWALSWGC